VTGLVIALAMAASTVAMYEPAAPSPPPRPPELRAALDTAIVATISVEALKRSFKDERPVGSGYAFPSGHATTSFALARVASEYHPKQKWLWYAIAARVAWSRVKLGAHDWDDVLAGAALGCWLGDVEVEKRGIVLKRWEW
jgi:membrane-associated phospholipid phosphatase